MFSEQPYAQPGRFTHSEYALKFIDYPGQESLAHAKRTNQRLLAAALDGTVLRTGETFSLWRLVGRPKPEQGYASAAAIRDHRLVTELGGATCLLSTVVYYAALLAGLQILERYCHSVDSYGSNRYFELGRDCAIVYGYRDLRFSNPFDYPITLHVAVDSREVRASISAEHACEFAVQLLVSEPTVERYETRIMTDPHLRPGQEVVVVNGHDGIRTRTIRRLVWRTGVSREDDLGHSLHLRIDKVVRRGVAREAT